MGVDLGRWPVWQARLVYARLDGESRRRLADLADLDPSAWGEADRAESEPSRSWQHLLRAPLDETADFADARSGLLHWMLSRGLVDASEVNALRRSSALEADLSVLLLEALGTHFPRVELDVPHDTTLRDESFDWSRIVPFPALTDAQYRYWRLRHQGINVFHELGYAELLARWILLLRGSDRELRLVTDSQIEWLRSPPSGADYVAALTRYVIGWHAVRHPDCDSRETSEWQLTFAAECAIDELTAGHGWAMFGPTARRCLQGVDGVGRLRGAGVLSWLIWRARRQGAVTDPLGTRSGRRPQTSAEGVDGPTPQVVVVGLVGHPSGVGLAADGNLAALDHLGLDCATVPIDVRAAAPGRELAGIRRLKTDVALLHVLPDVALSLLISGSHLWRDVGSVAGFYAWELPCVPRSHLPALRYVDAVWAPSQFCVDTFRRYTDRPVHLVPHWVNPVPPGALSSRPDARRRHGIPLESFATLVTFDAHSRVSRKNPIAAVTAWSRAFDRDPDVSLVLKVRNLDWLVGSARADAAAAQLLDLAATDSRIHLIGDDLSAAENMSLLSSCDVLLSMHRAEGFGYAMAEAMYYGVPTVATAFSGNLDYMDDTNSWLVPWERVSLQRDDFIYWERGAWWADPDVDSAAQALRSIRDGGESVNDKVSRAQARIRDDFSLTAAASAYREALCGCLSD